MVYDAGESGNWEQIVKRVNRSVIGVVEQFTQGPRPESAEDLVAASADVMFDKPKSAFKARPMSAGNKLPAL